MLLSVLLNVFFSVGLERSQRTLFLKKKKKRLIKTVSGLNSPCRPSVCPKTRRSTIVYSFNKRRANVNVPLPKASVYSPVFVLQREQQACLLIHSECKPFSTDAWSSSMFLTFIHQWKCCIEGCTFSLFGAWICNVRTIFYSWTKPQQFPIQELGPRL